MADIKTLLGDKYKEGMTDAEIVAAMQEVTLPDMTQFVPKGDYDKLKTASDNNASEAKSWKDKYNSTLSAAEQQKQADEEARKATETRLAELERKDKISTAKDGYVANGWDVTLAQATAEAFVDGKMDVVQANIQKHIANVTAARDDKDLKGTPAPPASGNGNPGTIDYAAEIAKALEAGDYPKAAYYTRIQNQKK